MAIDFDSWMKRVDALLISRLGFANDDLFDHCWADVHEEGLSARDAVEDFIVEVYSDFAEFAEFE